MTPEHTMTPAQPQQLAQQLVAQLHDLRGGPLALPQIVSMGAVAVPALEAFLRGPSQSLYHQRALAADALAAIGGPEAAAALLRALRDSVARALEPLALQAEDVVVSRIVEHLCRHPTPEVADALLQTLNTRPYPACARALGQLGDERAIAALTLCLYEDAARLDAVNALRRFGAAAIPRLRAVLAMPLRICGLEPPTRVAGRTAAAGLLGELGDQRTLIRALEDRESAVRTAAALALAQREGVAAPVRAVDILLSALGDADWARARVIMQALSGCGESLADPLLELLARDAADETSRRCRRRAAILAGRMALAAAAAPLAALAGDGDAQLRCAAVDALARISAAEPRQLAGFLADPEPAVARRALAALSRRDGVSARQIAHWLKSACGADAGASAWRRWCQPWRLLATAAWARARMRMRTQRPMTHQYRL